MITSMFLPLPLMEDVLPQLAAQLKEGLAGPVASDEAHPLDLGLGQDFLG
jgi:hypothetical protein